MATYIFDFDGTLADSVPIVRDIILNQAKFLGCRQLTLNEISALRNMHAYEVLKHLHVPFWKTFSFTNKLRKACNKRVDDITIFTEWFDVLHTLKNNQHALGIISSNSRKIIEFTLKKYHVYDFFDFITCETPLFGKAKILKKVIKSLHLNIRSGWRRCTVI